MYIYHHLGTILCTVYISPLGHSIIIDAVRGLNPNLIALFNDDLAHTHHFDCNQFGKYLKKFTTEVVYFYSITMPQA